MTHTLFWFTHDLRVSDNPALHLARDSDQLTCVYFLDPELFSPRRYHLASVGGHRLRFIQQSLDDLGHQLGLLGQHLYVTYESRLTGLIRIIAHQKINRLVCSRQTGYEERSILASLQKYFPSLPIEEVDSYTLYQQSELPYAIEDWPKHFTNFRICAEDDKFPAPLAAPESLPRLKGHLATVLPPESLNQIGAKPIARGGERAAFEHLNTYFSSAAPSSYKETRNALEGWEASSKFSPWLAQGCLSPRQILAALKQYEALNGANDSTRHLLFELLWREFFQWSGIKLGNKLFRFEGAYDRAPLTSFYPERFRKWCEGQTPYPIVNACMQELRQTGYLSNRGRQIAASALVNELAVDWRYGAAWFEHQLIDFDVNSNWGNWQYIAGVGADPRGGRHFNLGKQAAQFDPDGSYVRRWAGETPSQPLDSVDAADWPIPEQR